MTGPARRPDAPPRAFSDLGPRLISGVVLGLVALAALALGGVWTALLVAAAAAAMTWEWRAMAVDDPSRIRWLGAALALAPLAPEIQVLERGTDRREHAGRAGGAEAQAAHRRVRVDVGERLPAQARRVPFGPLGAADEARLLRDRQEATGADQLAVATPADQRLDRAGAPRAQVDLRLVVEQQLAVAERAPQLAQSARASSPCMWITFCAPPASCRASTFWVTMVTGPGQFCCSRASALWAVFGWAPAASARRRL